MTNTQLADLLEQIPAKAANRDVLAAAAQRLRTDGKRLSDAERHMRDAAAISERNREPRIAQGG